MPDPGALPDQGGFAVTVPADLKCRFGCDGPTGVYYMPKGCICWSDPVQALCAQHAEKAESTGPIYCILTRVGNV